MAYRNWGSFTTSSRFATRTSGTIGKEEFDTIKLSSTTSSPRNEKSNASGIEDYISPSSNNIITSIHFGKDCLLGPVDDLLVDLDDIKPGDRIHDYSIETLIGRGGFGTVFRATHFQDAKDVIAIKCVDLHYILSSASQEQELLNELSVLRRVNHPNIVNAYEVYRSPNTAYITMELASTDLCQYFKDVNNGVPFNDSTLREIMRGILLPLELLHSLGICHSDIKMENILVVREPQDSVDIKSSHIKLCDFGMCSFGSASNPGEPVWQDSCKGTRPLMAPEVFRPLKYDARPVDMWAVGCTLVEMTDGYPSGWEESFLYSKEDPAEFARRLEAALGLYHEMEEVVSDAAHEIARRVLRLEPTIRLTASDLLKHPWLA